MQLISIARGDYGAGKEVAERLGERLGCPVLAREELVDLATDAGIPVGKLEMAVAHRRRLPERLLLEKDRYRAFVQAEICRRLQQGRLVYHGRAPHLLLPGLAHVLRIRVTADADARVDDTMTRLGIPWKKARDYVEAVDSDISHWVRQFYNVEWESADHYDVVVNVERLHPGNAAAALTSVAELPDFQSTPASERAMADLGMAAEARLALANDATTSGAHLQVRAEGGRVSVSYLPQQANVAAHISAVLQRVDGVQEVVVSMATTSLLWVQDRFNPEDPLLQNVLKVARNWNASVDLVRLLPEGVEPSAAGAQAPAARLDESPEDAPVPADGGAADGELADALRAEPTQGDDGGLRRTAATLLEAGHPGSVIEVHSASGDVTRQLDLGRQYALAVVGAVYTDQDHSVQARRKRELRAFLAERLKVPAVEAEELKEQFLFTPKQAVTLVGCLAITALVYFLVFSHQERVLRFLAQEGLAHRALASAIILGVVVTIAMAWGTATRQLLRLIKME